MVMILFFMQHSSFCIVLPCRLPGRFDLPELSSFIEKQAKGKKGSTQTGIKDRDKHIRRPSARPQSDSACHHDGHNDKGLSIEKFQEKVALLWISMDSGGMLPHQLSKNKFLKDNKYQHG